uniref:Transposon n=1 Tax=Solanum tuberosum TaxID=4113 RepID=M1DKB8_SOLTU
MPYTCLEIMDNKQNSSAKALFLKSSTHQNVVASSPLLRGENLTSWHVPPSSFGEVCYMFGYWERVEDVLVRNKENAENKYTREYRSYNPFIIAQNAKQVYYAPYPLRRDKVDWWVVIKSKPVGGIEIENILDVAYQNDVAIVKQQVDVELETTLQHPQHILEEVSNDEILNVEEEISKNEENESFDEEEWENDGIETSEEE